MKKFLILIFAIGFSLNLHADFNRTLWFFSYPCPATDNEPAHARWTVLEDLNNDGDPDWATSTDCSGCLTEGPFNNTKVVIGYLGSSLNRANESYEFTDLSSPSGGTSWSVRSFNSNNNLTYYTVTSSNHHATLFIVPPPPSIKSNSNNSGTDLSLPNSNMYYVGKVQIFENQSYEFKVNDCSDSPSGKGWSNRVFNEATGETYYTVVSCNGKAEIVYPNSQMKTGSKDVISGLNKVYPNPANNQVQIEYNSEKSSNLDIILLDNAGKPVSQIPNYISKQGLNIISLDLNNIVSGSYMIKITDGTKIFTTPIIISK